MRRRILAVLLGLSAVLWLTGCEDKEASGVGIIGGADGPTTVFIAGHL